MTTTTSTDDTEDGAARTRRGVDLANTSLFGLEMARMLGRAARWASSRGDVLVDSLGRRRSRATAPTRELIEQLAGKVAGQGESLVEGLQNDPEFWRLVDQLHARSSVAQRRIEVARRTKSQPGAAGRSARQSRGVGGSDSRSTDGTLAESPPAVDAVDAVDATVGSAEPAESPAPSPAPGADAPSVDEASVSTADAEPSGAVAAAGAEEESAGATAEPSDGAATGEAAAQAEEQSEDKQE